MEIATGVHDVPQTIARGGVETTIHPAAVETPTGLLLVDAGYPDTVAQIEATLDDAGFEWADVRGVLVTHQDGDHAGALASVLDRTDAVVYAHPEAAPFVDGREHPVKSPAGERYPPVDVDVEVVDGVSFRTAAGPMDVLFTPGHAPGHLSLFLPDEGLLLAADALTADADGLAGPSEEYTLRMDRALASADRFTDLGVERTLCYHGGLVDAGSDRIGELVDSRR